MSRLEVTSSRSCGFSPEGPLLAAETEEERCKELQGGFLKRPAERGISFQKALLVLFFAR